MYRHGLSTLKIDESDPECDLKNPSENLECKKIEYDITAVLGED